MPVAAPTFAPALNDPDPLPPPPGPPIKSFVRRGRRLSRAQKYALDHYLPKHVIPLQGGPIDIRRAFGRRAPLILDIGPGRGDFTLRHARRRPENNYLAVEVHRPAIGHLLNEIERQNLTNIKIIEHDAMEALEYGIPAQSVRQALLFFPDPWPKKRHHKRRLLKPALLALLKTRLAAHGRLHIATDWADYAAWIADLFSQDPDFVNLAAPGPFAPRPAWRRETRYEARGIRLGHAIHDFCYALRTAPARPKPE